MRRPDKATVKRAIEAAGGNLSRAAAGLGCSRASLYCWVYQFGLERFAGVNMEDIVTRKATTTEQPVSVSVKLPESLWRHVRIRAIEEGCTASDLVRKALEASLAAESS